MGKELHASSVRGTPVGGADMVSLAPGANALPVLAPSLTLLASFHYLPLRTGSKRLLQWIQSKCLHILTEWLFPMLIYNRTNTSTHRCLHIAEIQGMIFGLLDRHECTQLARTCRSFYDQAMNVVWAQMGSLIPFVKCMPSEALIHVVTRTPNFCQVEIVSLSPLWTARTLITLISGIF